MRQETQIIKSGDGVDVFVRTYWPDEVDSARTLFWVHGLGEHGGRYEHVARLLAERGWRTIVPDLRGHGRSSGIPTHVKKFDQYIADLATVWKHLGLKDETTALLGHSMGGLIVVRCVQTKQIAPRVMILSSPLLGLKLSINPLAVMMGRLVVPFISTARFSNGVDPANMTHDSEFAALRRADPLINKTVTAGWFFAMKSALAAANRDVASVTLPVLALQGTLDCTTDPAALSAWLKRIGSNDREQIWLDEHYHELFFEYDWRQTLGRVTDWLETRVSDFH